MKVSILSILTIVLAICISSCVTKKSYTEVKELKEYYETEYEVADSINRTFDYLYEESRECEAQLRESMRDNEELTVANESLKKSYQDIIQKYNRLLNQNEEIVGTSAFEKQTLEEQLSAQQAALDQKARDLADMEFNLYQREQRLQQIEGNYTNLEDNLSFSQQRIRELEQMLNDNRQTMATLRARINDALLGFTESDLSVTERNGRIYVSLSQNLLYKSGSSKLDWKGKNAIQQLATVLNNNPDVDITVEGHTDSDGTTDKNWDLSVMRATSVVKYLVVNGVDPTRVIASGRGEHLPLESNASTSGKSRNRRTEIILAPKIDELIGIIGN